MLKHHRETYIHQDKKAAERKNQKRGLQRHEDKHYFKLLNPFFADQRLHKKNPAFTFVKVHNYITGGEVDTLKGRYEKRFDGDMIKIYDYTTDENHRHVEMGPPEIYANRYWVIAAV